MENKPELGAARFVIDTDTYCFWGANLREKNLTFLNGIDPTYFYYLAKSQEENLEGDNKQEAALAIRMVYGQALETSFALLFAALQAPHYVIGWLTKYRNENLNKLTPVRDKGFLGYFLRQKPQKITQNYPFFPNPN